jgi:hypothetical protein
LVQQAKHTQNQNQNWRHENSPRLAASLKKEARKEIGDRDRWRQLLKSNHDLSGGGSSVRQGPDTYGFSICFLAQLVDHLEQHGERMSCFFNSSAPW